MSSAVAVRVLPGLGSLVQILVYVSSQTCGALWETSLELLVQERMAVGTSATVWLPARLELVSAGCLAFLVIFALL